MALQANELPASLGKRRLTFDPRLAPRHASLFCLLSRLAAINAVNGSYLAARYVLPQRNAANPASDSVDQRLGRHDLRATDGLNIAALMHDLRVSTEDIYSSVVQSYIPWYRLTRNQIRFLCSQYLRYCPMCMGNAYHSAIFQVRAITHCPVHESLLIDKCPSCSRPLDYKLTTISGIAPFTCHTCGECIASHTDAVDWLENHNPEIETEIEVYRSWCRSVLQSIKSSFFFFNTTPDALHFKDRRDDCLIHNIYLLPLALQNTPYGFRVSAPNWVKTNSSVKVQHFKAKDIKECVASSEFENGRDELEFEQVNYVKRITQEVAREARAWNSTDTTRHRGCAEANEAYFRHALRRQGCFPCRELIGYLFWSRYWKLWDDQFSTLGKYYSWLLETLSRSWQVSLENAQEIIVPESLSAASVFFAGEIAKSTALNHLLLVNNYVSSLSDEEVSQIRHIEPHVPIDDARPSHTIIYEPSNGVYHLYQWQISDTIPSTADSSRSDLEHLRQVSERIDAMKETSLLFSDAIDGLLSRAGVKR